MSDTIKTTEAAVDVPAKAPRSRKATSEAAPRPPARPRRGGVYERKEDGTLVRVVRPDDQPTEGK